MDNNKRFLYTVVLLLTLLMVTGCTDENNTVKISADGAEDLAGTWLLNEHGYSPGDRYITEPVAPFPAQTIRFFADGRMTSNIGMISEYHFFEVIVDGQTQTPILVLYKTVEEVTEAEPVHSYIMQFPDGELRLSFRYCIEGCHMKFAKIAEALSDE